MEWRSDNSFFSFGYLQIGFLSEWQMYAQQIEGASWRGEKMDKTKIDKMSGTWPWHIGQSAAVFPVTLVP